MSIQSEVARLRAWTVDDALPFWGTTGFDAPRRSFFECVDLAGSPIVDAPRRTMVQARQIYVFAQAARLGWWPEGQTIALAAADAMIDVHYAPDGRPGWIFAATPEGAIHDATRDAYTQSFALLGLAWAHKLRPSARFRVTAAATLEALDQHFALRHPAGRRQNPHMHLFEAMIAWFEATGETSFLDRAAHIRTLLVERFFQADTHSLAEYFDDAWVPLEGPRGRIREPGHHFEWSWLLMRFAELTGGPRDVVADALYDHARRFGLDADGYVVDEILSDGSVHRPSRRCWPQAEAIKAHARAFDMGDRDAAQRAATMIGTLMATFLGHPIPGGWIDRFDATGAPRAAFIPASTLYHAVMAATEANRVWGDQ